MPNIIFLDIDGVLNTQKRKIGHMSSLDWSPDACRHVKQLCKEHNARIIVSSTWRHHHDLEELREFFADNDIAPELVTGTTPALINEKRFGTFCRGDEIARWLEQNDCENYVIIDDLPATHFLDRQQPNLVVVKQDKGFAEIQAVDRAGEILAGFMRNK